MKKLSLITFLFALTSYVNAQNLQQVTVNGNSTTKNISIGATEASLVSSGVVPQALNLVGKIKLLGLISGFTIGSDANQPTIYRSGINTGSYPFNNYDHLILQAGIQNRDIVFLTGSTPTIKMLVTATGNVGIGTVAPTEKLSVKGKIRAQEIKVEIANWPDYVFAPGYQPPSLAELEQFIKTNRHLPEIPSAVEVEKNGIELGDMNAKLLQKIEELTLHLIEMNKKVESQQEEINRLKKNSK